MNFKELKTMLQDNFKIITKDVSNLFEVDLDKDELWNLYLDSFPEGTNEIYRERREYDCSCCRHFIKTMGNVVVIKGGLISSIWDFKTNDDTFQPVLNALSSFVKSKIVNNVFATKFDSIGTDYNFENIGSNVNKYEHFYLKIPNKFVEKNKTIEEYRGYYRDIRQVFERGLIEISQESVETVLELIKDNNLYKGKEWEYALNEFLKYKKQYDKLELDVDKNNFCWENSVKAGVSIGKIKNHSIGNLLINISEGMDLEIAIKKYEVIVAPTNYKRPKAIFTKKMLEEAKKTIEDLGYLNSLHRRYATIDDITINNVLFSNKDKAKKVISNDIFEELSKEAIVNPRKYSNIKEIHIEKFINDILPNIDEMEVLFEGKHINNLVSLIAPQDSESKSMFKWNNSFGWAYKGNITDSLMKQNVKNAGGNVDGVLRFSIQWNDGEFNPNDFDAHCIEPTGNEIYYGNKNNLWTTGQLDVDIIRPIMRTPSVENITWTNIDRMDEGVYKLFVHNYSNNGGRTGFKAEIEFNEQIFSFEYNKALKQGEKISVAEVIFDKEIGFTLKEKLSSNVSSKEVWNLKTNNFVPVSLVMFSPNYWDNQNGIGNKHYMFMLKDCISSEMANGFYNEFLKEDLMKHKRVFEALGNKMRVLDVEEQLSGLGFSETKGNELIVKIKNDHEEIVKIKF